MSSVLGMAHAPAFTETDQMWMHVMSNTQPLVIVSEIRMSPAYVTCVLISLW